MSDAFLILHICTSSVTSYRDILYSIDSPWQSEESQDSARLRLVGTSFYVYGTSYRIYSEGSGCLIHLIRFG